MRRGSLWSLIIIIFIIPTVVLGAVRTSAGLLGGVGLPVGWWADRWDRFDLGEVNLRYEFAPGTGILVLVGLNKAYFSTLSKQEVASEARVHHFPEFDERIDVITAQQGGSFKQIPVGFGLYRESWMGGVRPYGSLAMVVHLWYFERSQLYYEERSGLNGDVAGLEDNWTDSQDGATLGAQIALGLLYPLRNLLFIDISASYHWVNIGTKYGALAYWGKPARTWDDDLVNEAKGSANFIQFRIGFRYGR